VSNVTFHEVADYFISLSNETGNLISNLKLQKLVYYTQAWHLGIYGEALFQADFEAWVHGPVIPELYREYRQFGWKPIIREDLGEDYIREFRAKLTSNELEVLNDVIDEYFGMTAFALEEQTHKEDPWLITRRGLPDDAPCDRVINNQHMIDYYSQFVTHGQEI